MNVQTDFQSVAIFRLSSLHS